VLGVVTRQKRQSLLAVSFTTVARRGDSQGAFFVSACEQLTGIVGTEHLGTFNSVGKDHRALPGAAGSEAATVPFPLSP